MTQEPSSAAAIEATTLSLEGGETLELQSVLGRGGMGVVYRAFQPAFSRAVAIKMLHKHLYSTQQGIARFLREARTTSALRHPNIVQTYSLGLTADQHPFLIMELVEGESLAELLQRNGTLTIDTFQQVFGQVLDALEYAHGEEVLHRDLKPANIMVTSGSGIKIMDFGIAKSIGESGKTNQSVTATGELIGSPLYMSPEQARPGQLDLRSDLYSVGCMMFEATEGFAPFRAESAFEVLMKHLMEPVPLMTGTAPALQIVIKKALEKNPTARYESAAEMKAAILEAIKNPTASKTAANPVSLSALKKHLPITLMFLSVICVAARFLIPNNSMSLSGKPVQTRRPMSEHIGLANSGTGSSPEALIRQANDLELRYQRNLNAPPEERDADLLTAKNCLLEAIKTANKDKAKFWNSLAKAEYSFGSLYSSKQPPDAQQSRIHYQKSVEIFEETKHDFDSQYVGEYTGHIHALALALEHVREFELAEKWLKKSLALRQSFLKGAQDSAGWTSESDSALAELYCNWGKYEQAEKFGRLARDAGLALGEETNDRGLRVRTLHGYYLLCVHKDQEAFTELLQVTKDAKSVARSDPSEKSVRALHSAMFRLSQAYLQLGHTDKSNELSVQAKEIDSILKLGQLPNIDDIEP